MPDWKKLILENHQRNHKVDRSELIQGDPCSEEELARLEEMIGLNMPAEFRDLYRVADGFGNRSDKEYWLLAPIRNIPQLIKDARNWFEETHPELAARFFPFIDWSSGDYTGYLVSKSGKLEKGLYMFEHELYEFEASQKSDEFLYPSGDASIEEFVRL